MDKRILLSDTQTIEKMDVSDFFDTKNDSSEMHIYRKKTFTGVKYLCYLGHFTEDMRISCKPDLICFRPYISNDIKIKTSDNDHVLSLQKTFLMDSFAMYKDKKVFGHIHYLRGSFYYRMITIFPTHDNNSIGLHWNRKLLLSEVKYLSKKTSYPGVTILRTKKPYCINNNLYLPFKQQGGIKSCKNFQIKKKNKILLELLKVNNNELKLIYTQPFSPIIAFSTAISQCWKSF